MKPTINLGFVVRIALFSAMAALATLKASLGNGVDAGEWIDVVTATLVTGATYAGIGGLSKTVEPEVGRTE